MQDEPQTKKFCHDCVFKKKKKKFSTKVVFVFGFCLSIDSLSKPLQWFWPGFKIVEAVCQATGEGLDLLDYQALPTTRNDNPKTWEHGACTANEIFRQDS